MGSTIYWISCICIPILLSSTKCYIINIVLILSVLYNKGILYLSSIQIRYLSIIHISYLSTIKTKHFRLSNKKGLIQESWFFTVRGLRSQVFSSLFLRVPTKRRNSFLNIPVDPANALQRPNEGVPNKGFSLAPTRRAQTNGSLHRAPTTYTWSVQLIAIHL